MLPRPLVQPWFVIIIVATIDLPEGILGVITLIQFFMVDI